MSSASASLMSSSGSVFSLLPVSSLKLSLAIRQTSTMRFPFSVREYSTFCLVRGPLASKALPFERALHAWYTDDSPLRSSWAKEYTWPFPFLAIRSRINPLSDHSPFNRRRKVQYSIYYIKTSRKPLRARSWNKLVAEFAFLSVLFQMLTYANSLSACHCFDSIDEQFLVLGILLFGMFVYFQFFKE